MTRALKIQFGSLVFSLLLVWSSASLAETTFEKIRRTGEMTLANTFTYPPFGFIENGQKVGFDVDIANEIAHRMNVKITFETIDFRGIIAALKSKRVDALITGMVYTPDRAKQIAFSEPYFDGGIAAAFQNSHPVEDPNQLLGKRVGVELGSAGDKFVQEKLAPNVTKLTYDTEFLGLKDLENGRIDAFVGSIAPMRYIMRQMPGLKVSQVWDHRIQAANTRLEDIDLLNEFNRQLRAMKEDGSYDKLVRKWFGE